MKSTQFAFEAIGTSWVIDIFDIDLKSGQDLLLAKVMTCIASFDETYSRFIQDSTISQASMKVGEYDLPENSEKLFRLTRKLYDATDGLFTPLIGNVMEDAGYDRSYSLKSKSLRSPLKWEDAIKYSENKLHVKKPVLLDFGGLGKGYLVDLVCKVLENEGVRSYCVDAGGDIYYKNPESQSITVGLEHPENPKQVIGVAQILNQSICGSATNRRKWGDYHHIINPKTLSSPQNIISVWTVADSAVLADGLATCLFLVDPEKLINEFRFEYLILFSDYHIKKSEHFPAEIYYNNSS